MKITADLMTKIQKSMSKSKYSYDIEEVVVQEGMVYLYDINGCLMGYMSEEAYQKMVDWEA